MNDYTIALLRAIWISYSYVKYAYLVFFGGKTMLDHYIFYSPPPNPWFKPDN